MITEFVSEEQTQFQDTIVRLLRDRYDTRQRNAHAASARGWSEEVWRAYADLGILGATLPEAYGGSAGGGIELMLIMEAFGRATVLEPFFPSIVLCGTALVNAAPQDVRDDLLPRMIVGDIWLGWAHLEAAGLHEECFVETSASCSSGGWLIDGAKILVGHGDSAHAFVVTARVDGPADAEGGLGLFLVDGEAAGLTREKLLLHDGTAAANLRFEAVRATPLGKPGNAWPAIRNVLDHGIVAAIADSVGAMDACLAATVDYLKIRKQFGVAIGSNQALQHRAADMLVALEQARSMALLAAMAIDTPPSAERARKLSRAKLLVGRYGRLVAQEAIQLHGGIGVTEEAGIGNHFRRLMTTEAMYGDPRSHLRKLSDELLSANK